MDKINIRHNEQYGKLLHVYGNESTAIEVLRDRIQSEEGIVMEFLNTFNNGIDLELNKSKLIDKYDTIENGILNLQSMLNNGENIDSELLPLIHEDVTKTAHISESVIITDTGGDLCTLEKAKFERSLAIMSMELDEHRSLELLTEDKPEQPKLINKGKSFHDQKKNTRFMNKRK